MSTSDLFTTRRSLLKSAAIAAPLVAAGAVTVWSVPSAAAQDASPTAGTTTIETKVRVLHAAPDLGKVEVFFDGSEELDEFEYGDMSEWLDLEPGSVYVTITADRAGINYALFAATYPVQAGNHYTFVISDPVIITGLVDQSPIPDGAARVRFTHASVGAPAINIVAGGDKAQLATQLTYPKKSDYAAAPAGAFDVEIQLADSGEVIATITGITLTGNTVYDLIVHGEPSGEDHPLTITAIDAPTETA